MSPNRNAQVPGTPTASARRPVATSTTRYGNGLGSRLKSEANAAGNGEYVYQSVPGDDSIYPDGLIVETATKEMDQLACRFEKPFFLAVGIIRLCFNHSGATGEISCVPYRSHLTLPPIPAS